MAKMIKSKLKNQPQIINLMDFYLPLRGNLRRRNSTDSSNKEVEQAQIEKELTEIDRNYDFDDPQAIDWDLLIVFFTFCISQFASLERLGASHRRQTLQQTNLR